MRWVRCARAHVQSMLKKCTIKYAIPIDFIQRWGAIMMSNPEIIFHAEMEKNQDLS